MNHLRNLCDCVLSKMSRGVLLFWVVGRDMKWVACLSQVRQLHVHPGRGPCLNVRWQKENDDVSWWQPRPKVGVYVGSPFYSRFFNQAVSSVQCGDESFVWILVWGLRLRKEEKGMNQTIELSLNSYWNGHNDQMDFASMDSTLSVPSHRYLGAKYLGPVTGSKKPYITLWQ